MALVTFENKVDLTEKNVPLINKIVADDINQLKEGVNINEANIDSVYSGYKGTIVVSDTPTEIGIYTPTEESSDYVNAGNLSYLPSTTDNGFEVTFIKNTVSWIKKRVNLGITFDETPTEESENAVWSGGVVDFVNSKFTKSIKRTSLQLFEYTTMIPFVDMSFTSGGDLVSASSSVGTKIAEIVIDEESANKIFFGGFFTNNGLNYRSRFVDENGDYINGTVANNFGSGNSTKVFEASIPTGAAKFQFTILRPENVSEDFTTTMVNFGDSAIPYEDYTSSEEIIAIDDLPISADVVKEEGEYYSEINQLFSKVTMQINESVVDSSGVVIGGYPNRQVLSMPLLNYVKNTPIAISGVVGTSTSGKYYSFLDADGNILYFDYFRSDKNIIFCPVDGAVLLNATIKVDADPSTYADAIMINYGANYKVFESYVAPISYNYIKNIEEIVLFPDVFAPKNILFQKPFYEQKVVTIGDSITYQCRWQFPLMALLNTNWSSGEVINGGVDNVPMGVGGSTIAPIITGITGQTDGDSIYYRSDYVSNLEPDVIILMGGQNDGFSTNYNIYDTAYAGVEVTVGSGNEPSFTSSYKGVLEKLVTQNPTAKIICLSPLYTKGTGVVDQSYYEDMIERDIAIENMAKMYGCHFVSMLKCGISRQNADFTTRDGTHPNDDGGLLMAKYIYSQIS